MTCNFQGMAKLLLPEVYIHYLIHTNRKAKGEELHFYFKEINSSPVEFIEAKPSPKGFFPEVTIQDLFIKVKDVYFHITRCRCLNEPTNKVAPRDWQLAAKRTKDN